MKKVTLAALAAFVLAPAAAHTIPPAMMAKRIEVSCNATAQTVRATSGEAAYKMCQLGAQDAPRGKCAGVLASLNRELPAQVGQDRAVHVENTEAYRRGCMVAGGLWKGAKK